MRDATGRAPAGADRWILHVDMDAFFASVEALDDPSLAGRPLIVGGSGPRGVVASCSYEARAFGVRSAMPSARARSLCPEAVFVQGRYARYAEVSRSMHAVFESFTPVVEGISLDEAFLDVTGSLRIFGPPAQIARDIRARVAGELGLSCSVGASRVKFLAKLASEAAKPDARPEGDRSRRQDDPSTGVCVVAAGEELAFLHPHPVEALWGVGPATARRLRNLGIRTVGELSRVPVTALEGAVGRASGAHLARLARGVDDRSVVVERPARSVSHEETYPVDRADLDGLHLEVLRMADAVASRLRAAGLGARTVVLKYRYGDFSTHTRSTTSSSALSAGPSIGALAAGMLDAVDLHGGLRLLGIGVANLVAAGEPATEQLALGLDDVVASGRCPSAASRDSRPSGVGPSGVGHSGVGPSGVGPSGVGHSGIGRSEDAARAVDAVRRRFGEGAVGPAALLGEHGLRLKRRGEAQWGPPALRPTPEPSRLAEDDAS